MIKSRFKYIYGPVYSWRLGMSLGIDPLSAKSKACNMDCVYCQLGKTAKLTHERKEFISVSELMDEINMLPSVKIDHFTFSGRGEPTLAKNLGEMISALRKLRREKVAVITNSTLIGCPDVQEDLLLSDYVLAKLDAYDQHSFQLIDRVDNKIQFDEIIEGIKSFRSIFLGKFVLQVMFIEENKPFVKQIVKIVQEILPDEVQINTPLRQSKVRPLTVSEMAEIKKYFEGLPVPVASVYEHEHKEISAFDKHETGKRHGNYSIN